MSDNMVQKKKKKSIWLVVDGLLDRLAGLIRDSALVEMTEDAIWELLNEEFHDQIEEIDLQLTKVSLHRRIEELVWTNERLLSLGKLVRHGMSLDIFMAHHKHIPPAMVKRKAREFQGISRVTDVASFVPGINRLDVDAIAEGEEDFELPVTSFDEPFVAFDGDLPDGFGVATISGPSVGLAHSRLIEENPFRCALELAERRGDKVLFLTGGLVDLELKKAAGPLAMYRAAASGYNTNCEVIAPEYRERVEHLLEQRPPGELIYETHAERFLNVMAGVRKICLKPNGKPEFTGTVAVQLGYKEEELINTAAYWEVRYWTIVRNNQLGIELTLANRAVRGAEKELREAVEMGDAEESLAVLRQRVADLTEQTKIILHEKQRTVISNITDADKQRYARRTRAFVVRKIQEAIPNSIVIGMGKSHVRVGPTIWSLHQAKNDRVAEGMLDSYIKKAAGSVVLSGRLTPMVLLASRLSPNYRMAVVEHAKAGVRSDSQVFQLPVCLDFQFLRQNLRDTIRAAHPIQKLLSLDQSESGTVRFVHVNGTWHPEVSLIRSQQAQIERARKRGSSGTDVSYLYIYMDTDPHIGHPWKMYVWDRRNERMLGLGRAVVEMMRRGGLFEEDGHMPVHMTTLNDDGIQAHNFDTQKQPHPNILSGRALQKALALLVKKGNVEGMRRLAIDQDLRRGEHWTQTQLNDFLDVELGENRDFYEAILRRCQQSNILIRGRSEIVGDRVDQRDIGVINLGSGNHLANTVDREIFEGAIYARYLRALCSGRPQWDGQDAFLKKMIRAPRYGNDHIGWGTFGIDGGYQWGISLRSDPTRKNSHGDPLKRFIENILYRGNFSRIFDGIYTVHLVGDIHRFGTIITPQAAAISCASGTDTDPFGERGFTPNNTGVLFVGLPVDGPNSGPIRVVTMRHEFIRNYFEQKNPKPVNWEALLPNAV